jgi:phage shock protein A
MDGILHILERVGQSLAMLEQQLAQAQEQIADLTAERDQLRAKTAETPVP